MNQCRFTLLTDGSSDRALLPPITWLLREKLPGTPLQLEWADLSRVPRPLNGLGGRIQAAFDNYPCDVLFVHRDAEGESREKRVAEIKNAFDEVSAGNLHVCVITVRMQEAWMLIDEDAIRSAAGNPSGTIALDLPTIQQVENIPDPKNILHELLRKASGLTGRRLKKFSASAKAHRVAELVDNWELLRKLPAFREFEQELDLVLGKLNI